MSSRRLVCGVVVMATVMLVFLQRSAAAADERRQSPSRSRSSSSSSSSSPRGSNRGRGIGNAPGSSAGQHRVPNHDLPYHMACPELHCAPLPRDCQTIEFFSYEVQYDLGSRGPVGVQCRSCNYCLDVPHTFPARGIRNYGNRQEVREASPCSMFHCPPLPETCIDVRLTSVLVSGQECDQCPVCYDQTVINVL